MVRRCMLSLAGGFNSEEYKACCRPTSLLLDLSLGIYLEAAFDRKAFGNGFCKAQHCA